jgi:LPS sulfotransferase NodH
LNYDNEMVRMLLRLAATGPDDYFTKLTARRTSRNGVFGLKTHFHHFEAALRTFPGLLAAMPDVRYIYINRKDKLAQAVSMAKAYQTQAWVSFSEPARKPLFYSKDFIAACLGEVRIQTEAWERWFAGRKIDPLIIHYEDVVADRDVEIAKVLRLLGTEGDEPEEISLPEVRRQSDSVNAEWILQFRADTELEHETQNVPLRAASSGR